MTQKQLGEVLGFLGKTSDVRMAQYESEARIPKHDLVKEMACIFDVSTHALTVPDIDTYIGLMHTFFALEDMYGLKIREVDGEVVFASINLITPPIPLWTKCFVHGLPKQSPYKVRSTFPAENPNRSACPAQSVFR